MRRIVAIVIALCSAASVPVALGNQNPAMHPIFPAGANNNLVGVRFKGRINANFQSGAKRHIIFWAAALIGGLENGSRYALQVNLYNDGLDHNDLTQCEATQPVSIPSQGRLIPSIDDAPSRCPSVIPPADAACPASGVCNLDCTTGQICPGTNTACVTDRGICPNNSFCWAGQTCPGGTACPANRGICPGDGVLCFNGHFGVQTFNPGMFPRTSREIDGIPGYTLIQANSQMDMNDLDFQVEIVRDAVFSFATDTTGYGERVIPDGSGGYMCSALLPADDYRAWDTWIRLFPEGAPTQLYRVRSLARRLAGTNASDFMQTSPQPAGTIVTEFLYDPGFFQIFYWDLEIKRNGSSIWEAVDTFVVDGQDPGTPSPVAGSSGIRLAEYDGRSVVEISNDGTDTYFESGDPTQFTLPADPDDIESEIGCDVNPTLRFCLPTVSWDATESITQEGTNVTVTAFLDSATSQTITIPVIVGGTADSADHNLPSTAYLTIPAQATQGSLTFTVFNNNDPGNGQVETVTLRLHAPLAHDPNEINPANDAKVGQHVVHTVSILPSCGNGVLDTNDGEACDDGNNDPGDCCAPNCQLEPALSPCGDDANVCTLDVCSASGTCTHPCNVDAPCGPEQCGLSCQLNGMTCECAP